MNELQIFNNLEFGEVRILQINNESWFVAKDICNILDIKNPTMALQNLDEDERTKLNLGRQGETNLINESGLYALIVRSRKSEAKKFRKWVTSEVLPQIRQTGGYIPVSQEDDEKLILAKALMITKRTIEQKEQLLQQANKTIQEQKPLVELAKDFIDKDGLTSVDDFAKNLAIKGLGRNNMYKYLREHKILMNDEYINPMTLQKNRGENHHKPYSRFINEGKFVWKPTSYNKETGKYNHKPFLTVKGVEYMLKRLKNEGYLK